MAEDQISPSDEHTPAVRYSLRKCLFVTFLPNILQLREGTLVFVKSTLVPSGLSPSCLVFLYRHHLEGQQSLRRPSNLAELLWRQRPGRVLNRRQEQPLLAKPLPNLLSPKMNPCLHRRP